MPEISEDIDDIEDLWTSIDVPSSERKSNRNFVKVRPKKSVKSKGKHIESVEKTFLTSVIPGTQKIYIKTWGCAHNNSDSEYMAGQLAAFGYVLTEDKDEADLWLLNSCTVKSPAEDHFRNEIEAGTSRNKHVVIAGCVPQGAPKATFIKGLSIIGVQQIDRVVEVVEETLKGHTVRLLGTKTEQGKKAGGASLLLPKVRKNPLVEIIAINTGCLNQCTYCKTKHARGALGSYSPDEIVTRAQQAFNEGVVEIWLTSEDTGAYGLDIGTSLSELLFQLIEVIPDGCKMRVGMTNPPYIRDQLQDVAEALAHPRLYSFIHIPVQSGSDVVLSDMKREYTRQDFEEVVDYLQEKVPGITIATDIICGFPTESEEDFEETLSLCAKYKFPSLFINQFFPRPGTPAAKMKRIPAQAVKGRTKRLTELFYSYEPYGHKLGQIQSILVTDVSHDKKYYVGHNEFYEQVLVPMQSEFMGKMIQVKIVNCTKFSMIGEVASKDIINPGLVQPLAKGQVSGVEQSNLSHMKYVYTILAISVLLRIFWFLFVKID